MVFVSWMQIIYGKSYVKLSGERKPTSGLITLYYLYYFIKSYIIQQILC